MKPIPSTLDSRDDTVGEQIHDVSELAEEPGSLLLAFEMVRGKEW